MIEALDYAFMQRALIAGMLIAVICSAIGVFLVLRRMSLLGDGLAHIAFGGVAAGMFLGIYPLASAMVFSVLSAFGIQKLRDMRIYGDAAIAVFFAFGLSLGVVLISMSNGFNADLFSYLFGSILSVSQTDILIIGAFGAAVLTVLWLLCKELLYITFDEESAKAGGIKTERLNTLLIVLVAVAVVLSMRIVGVLLVSSLIAIPASIALMQRESFGKTILISISAGVSAVVVGLLAAYYFDLAAGGAVVLTLVLMFAISLINKSILGRTRAPTRNSN